MAARVGLGVVAPSCSSSLRASWPGLTWAPGPGPAPGSGLARPWRARPLTAALTGPSPAQPAGALAGARLGRRSLAGAFVAGGGAFSTFPTGFRSTAGRRTPAQGRRRAGPTPSRRGRRQVHKYARRGWARRQGPGRAAAARRPRPPPRPLRITAPRRIYRKGSSRTSTR